MNLLKKNNVVQKLVGIILILHYVPNGHSKEFYELNINENGTPFNETIEIDDVDKTVIYKVPSHNKLKESDVLVDYKNGHIVRKIPEKEECYIRSFSTAVEQSFKETKQNLKLLQHIKSRPKATVPVRTIKMIMKRIREIPPEERSTYITGYCGNYTTYEVKEDVLQENEGRSIIKRALTTVYYSLGSNAKNFNKKVPNGFPTCQTPGQHLISIQKCFRKGKNPRAACGRFPLSCRYQAYCELLPTISTHVVIEDLGYRYDLNAPIVFVKCSQDHVYTLDTCCDVVC